MKKDRFPLIFAFLFLFLGWLLNTSRNDFNFTEVFKLLGLMGVTLHLYSKDL